MDDNRIMLNNTGQQINERLREIRNVLAGNIKGTVYGFHIDSDESDPEDCVTYIEDAAGMTPAYMDFANDKFVWGSWRGAFFMPRPCMLNYDGTVAYYLDPDDYGKKYDGTDSDVDDDTFGGNAMMEWGQDGTLIWYKIVPDEDDPASASVYFADCQADEDFHCWSFYNNQGEIADHFYTPIYNGSIDSAGRLRSISGKGYADLCRSRTAEAELAAARLNNPGTDILWNTEAYADVQLINLLLILISKSLDSQAAFGMGRCGQSWAESNMLSTGTMDGRGMFWGYGTDGSYGVKVFGMENWWGNQWRRYLGHVMIDNEQKYKLTYGRQDGSAADGYAASSTAADYDGYITGAAVPAENGFAKTMEFSGNGVFQNKQVQADSTLYYCSHFAQASGLRFAFRGGNCGNDAAAVGFVCAHLGYAPALADWSVGAAPSCKPLSERVN